MNKNIIFLVGEYYPNFSAVSACCYNIAEVLKEKFSITVISLKSNILQPKYEEFNNHKIIRCESNDWTKRLKYNKIISETNGIKKIIYRYLLAYYKIKSVIFIHLSRTSIRKDIVQAYLNTLQSINPKDAVLIPVCFPFETVVACLEYKKLNPSVILIPYLFDPFVQSDTLHRTNFNKKIKFNSNLMLENEMIKYANHIFAIKQQIGHFTAYHPHYINITYTEHALLKPREKYNKICNQNFDKFITLTYTGVLDKKIRNPKFALRFISDIAEKTPIKFIIYSYGNCNDILKVFESKHILNYGYVPKEKADSALLDSDILVSIGNVDNKQVPSKVIEYISSLKPIIHFYKNNLDPNINILEKYPNSICIEESTTYYEDNLNKVLDFIFKSKHITLNYDQLMSEFITSTPNYIANQILDKISYVRKNTKS